MGKMIRQLDFLSEFRFQVLHIPGKDNMASDGHSRRPDHYLESDGSERQLVGNPAAHDNMLADDHDSLCVMLASRNYRGYIRRRLILNLHQYRERQQAATALESSSS